MARQKVINIQGDIEYRVIANAFGLLISSAGLLGGAMVNQRSFDYWLEDIVPIVLSLFLGYRLFRNVILTIIAYKDELTPAEVAAKRERRAKEELSADQAIIAQIAASTPHLSEQQVMEEVAKRIESRKLDALKKNKFIN